MKLNSHKVSIRNVAPIEHFLLKIGWYFHRKSTKTMPMILIRLLNSLLSFERQFVMRIEEFQQIYQKNWFRFDSEIKEFRFFMPKKGVRLENRSSNSFNSFNSSVLAKAHIGQFNYYKSSILFLVQRFHLTICYSAKHAILLACLYRTNVWLSENKWKHSM